MSEITQVNNYLWDERYYCKIFDDVRIYQPSVTYILSEAYPIGHGLIQWKGDVGNKRAQEIMEESGEEGSYVHDAIDQMMNGCTITTDEINDHFSPARALKIHRCLKSFLDWWDEYKPEVIAHEYITWDNRGWAGTIDLHAKINGENVIIDYKTSNTIQDKHKAQLAAYGLSEGIEKRYVLHLGNKTKKKYSFIEVDKKYEEQWMSTLKLFQILNPNARPSDEMFPNEYKLTK